MNIIIEGTVISGLGLGKKTGLKTANLDTKIIEKEKLKKGLYNCVITYKNSPYNGLLYYGHNSISKKDCLEVHIINFDQEIYGEQIKIAIGKYLRPPKKFTSVKKLEKQIQEDLKILE